MRAAALVLLLAASLPVHADSIAHQGNDWARLTLHACNDPKVVAVIEANGEHADAFRAASAHFGGADFVACWRPVTGGAYLLYEDGDKGFLPTNELSPVPEA